MAEGRQRDSWAHTSAILALTANCNRDPKKHEAFNPDDFSPFGERKKKETVSLEEMKDLFTGKKQLKK